MKEPEFELHKMYSELHQRDMWWIKRAKSKHGKKDYFGPYINKVKAQKMLDAGKFA